MTAPLNLPSLAVRLRDAADWLGEEIPENTPEISILEGDVRLDELDLYCVRLMTEAATAAEALAEHKERLEGALRAILAANRGAKAEDSRLSGIGLVDAIDNHGKPYQSAYLAGWLEIADRALSDGDATHG